MKEYNCTIHGIMPNKKSLLIVGFFHCDYVRGVPESSKTIQTMAIILGFLKELDDKT